MFSQHDRRWKDKRLGLSSYRCDDSGCLCTSVAAQLNALGFRTHPGMFIDQANLRGGFQDPLGYLRFDFVRVLTNGKYILVNNDATNKLKTIIEGYLYFRNGRTKHWVYKVGGVGPDGSEMICDPNDPLNSNAKPLGQFTNFKPTGRRAYIRKG